MDKKTFLSKQKPKLHNQLFVDICNDISLDIFNKYIKGGRLLDIGCGSKPYADFFEDIVDEHIGLDHPECQHNQDKIDVFGDVYNMPFENESFDNAISTAVLEHMEEPQTVINETYRVLKQGGYAIYTVPQFFPLHEKPRDFFRYTKYGIEYLFQKAGFEIVESIPLSGFWVTFGVFLNYNIKNDKHFKWIRSIKADKLLMRIVNSISQKLDKNNKSNAWAWMYLIVGRKN